MMIKIILSIIFIALILYATVIIARILVARDNEDIQEEVERDICEDAKETIREAKRWLEEDNQNYGGDSMGDILNKNTLGELLALEPEDKHYEEYVGMVGKRVKELFEDYQFFLYEPDKADLVSGYLMQFQILGHEPIYNELFVYAMDSGLEMDKIDEFFLEALKEGDILPIGEGIILDEEGTGISPIKSGDDVRVIISFVTDEYKARQEEAEKEAEATEDE